VQAWYDAQFDREMGLSAADFLRCLPGAMAPHAIHVEPWPEHTDAHVATIDLPSGRARMTWRELPARVIALVRLPRVAVHFDFRAIDEAERQRVLKRFDLVMLRGGG
jgi:hypothetical protein